MLVLGIMILIIITGIFLLTMILTFWQRSKIAIGWLAITGAIAILLTGICNGTDLILIGQIMLNPLLTIVALVVITRLFEQAGLFAILGKLIINYAQAQGLWLWFICLFLMAILSLLFNNYTSILIGTPIILAALRSLRLRGQTTLIYLLSAGWMADFSSLLLPGNNPVNAIASSYFQIPLGRYLLVILPIHFCAVLLSLAVLWFYCEPYLPGSYRLRPTSYQDFNSGSILPTQPQKTNLISKITNYWQYQLASNQRLIRDPLLCQWGLPILALIWATNLLLQFLEIQQFSGLLTSLIALFSLSLVGRWFNTEKPVLDWLKILRQLSWQPLLFSIGIYIIVYSLGKAGLINFLSQILTFFSGWGLTLATIGTGFVAMLLSGVMQNFATVTNTSLALQDALVVNRTVSEGMLYANLIGCTLGAKITPIGSLSSLLWLIELQRRGLRLRWSQYLRIHGVLTLPVLFFTLLFLAIWLPWTIA